MGNKDILEFIKDTESRFFRTDCDTGANPQVMMIWNQVRMFAGLNRLKKTDLPTFCKICKKYHTGACENLILVKSQKTGELFRIKMGAVLPSDLKKIKKLGGRDVNKKDGSLIDSFHNVKIIYTAI